VRVTIKLFAFFRESRFKIENRDLEKGTTVGNIVDVLGINREEIGVLMINSRHTTLETELSENDILAIFPVIGGG
jgi:molybdopterin synthase sulfur carrier subunit